MKDEWAGDTGSTKLDPFTGDVGCMDDDEGIVVGGGCAVEVEFVGGGGCGGLIFVYCPQNDKISFSTENSETDARLSPESWTRFSI